MIKVMLVDDEPFIRKGLREMVDWDKYGYTIAAEAANGAEAVKILEETEINLIFVDLKMPGMTGLELIQYVKRQYKESIQFVILTGYAEFDYAKKAIQYNVKDYMLKPIHEEELIFILENMNREYQDSQKEKRESFEYNISKIIMGRYSRENLENAAQYFDLENEWRYVSFEFDKNDENFKEQQDFEKIESQKKLSAYLQNLLNEKAYHVVPSLETEENIFGVGILIEKSLYETEHLTEKEYLLKLQKRASQYFDCKIFVYIGQSVLGMDKICQSYQSIRVTRCLQNFTETGVPMAAYEDYRSKKISIQIREEQMEELLLAVKNNEREKIISVSELVFRKIRESDMTMEMVNASIYYIFYRLMEMAREFDNETNQQEVLQYIGKESFDDLILNGDAEELNNFFLDYAGYLAQVRREASKVLIDKVEDYIKEHYNENLSLKFLGEEFYINNVYLGQVFKKRFGMGFKEYLNNLRIEKAQELLLGSNLRIYAIAKQVGFGNVDYFISKFVQAKGITPNQFRMMNR